MIIFDKLWETLNKRNISQYKLIKDYGFSSGQLDRLRKKIEDLIKRERGK